MCQDEDDDLSDFEFLKVHGHRRLIGLKTGRIKKITRS